MQELKKADITIEMTPKYVKYECPHCGREVEVSYSDFEDERTSDYWPEWEGDTGYRESRSGRRRQSTWRENTGQEAMRRNGEFPELHKGQIRNRKMERKGGR